MSDLEDLLSAVVASVGGSTRQGQVDMAHRVCEALTDRGHLLICRYGDGEVVWLSRAGVAVVGNYWQTCHYLHGNLGPTTPNHAS